jgi:fucose 4-O-acetylase-like acetyltransferase
MSPQKSRERDPWLDNAKMALVTLVVVGHAWTLLPDDAVNRHLYDFLYAWHIPAFVLVTGYLSRGFEWTGPRLLQLVRTVAVPYVIFECAFALFRIYVGGERLEDLFLNPHWPLWYLSALFLWRLATPIFRGLPLGLLLAVVLSLAAGVWFADTLDLARVFGLLPFFVLGLKASPERLEWLRSRWARVAAVVVFGGVVAATWFIDSWASTEWLYYRAMYVELTTSDAQAVATRAGVLAIGLGGALAFLALVPRMGGWFSRMGGATLVVYLFHGFAVKGAEFAGFQGWADRHEVWSLVLTTLFGLGLSLLLAARPVAARLTYLVDPFGYADRHTKDAVTLAIAAEQPIEDLLELHPDQPPDQPPDQSQSR